MQIRSAQKLAWANKVTKGFNTIDAPLEFCLLQGEIAEAFDAWHKGREDVGEELFGSFSSSSHCSLCCRGPATTRSAATGDPAATEGGELDRLFRDHLHNVLVPPKWIELRCQSLADGLLWWRGVAGPVACTVPGRDGVSHRVTLPHVAVYRSDVTVGVADGAGDG